MGVYPDLTTVREYLRVPATALSDADLQRMMGTAEADQRARCLVPEVIGSVTLDDLTVTVDVTAGPPSTNGWVAWGDTYSDPVALDANGAGTVAHTYAEAGTFTVVLFDAAMSALGWWPLSVPGNGTVLGAIPDPLAQAFLRRVQREVAARNLPLGMVGLDAGEYGPERLPYYDALVEEHERAFRRVVLA